MADCEDQRRGIAKRLIARFPGVKWTARPMVDSEQAQEFVMLSPDEVLWSLPCCDDTPPPPDPIKTQKLVVNTDTLNVRATASLDAAVMGTLKRGAEVIVEDGSGDWARLISPYGGRFVFRSLLRPT